MHFKEGEPVKGELVIDGLFSKQSGVPAVQDYSLGESAGTLAPFRNDVEGRTLRDFLVYGSRQKDGNYVDGPTISIASVDAWVVTMVLCLLERERHAEDRQKEYVDKYGSTVETAIKQLFEDVK